MLMEKRRKFLNLEVDDVILEPLDASARKSGLDRSKQARALIEFALGIQRKPYIPVQRVDGLPFNTPIHDTPGKKSRRRRKAA